MVDVDPIFGYIIGAIGAFGGAITVVITVKLFKRTREEDRQRFLKAQEEQLNSKINGATKEVKDLLNTKFKEVEGVLRTRGEMIEELKVKVGRIAEDVNELEKKAIAYDLKLPEIDTIKKDISDLTKKFFEMQLAK